MEGRPIPTVAVMDEKTRWLTIPTASLDDLLSRPLACRVARGSDVHEFPTGVMNDEKDIDCPEEDRLNAEEAAGPDFTGMQGKKITPARLPARLIDYPDRDRLSERFAQFRFGETRASRNKPA